MSDVDRLLGFRYSLIFVLVRRICCGCFCACLLRSVDVDPTARAMYDVCTFVVWAQSVMTAA